MTEAPSSTTPRLGDTSSAESPGLGVGKTTPAQGNQGNNPQATNGVPKVSFNTPNGAPVFDESNFQRFSPESDAVALSDDEEQKGPSFLPKGAVSQMSSRRPSYAAEFHTRQRTFSISSGGPLSPTTSHPTTPQGDTAAWVAGVSSAAVGPGTAASLGGALWGGSIWNADPSRKSPPKLTNSQSVNNGPGANPLFAGSEALPSPTSLAGNNVDFPIPIPLQPQFRNYRSMSFSVGQMELEDQNRPRLSPPAMLTGPRHSQPGLQHRPSRPSLLSGEQYPDAPSPLRSVFETEDEEHGRLLEGQSQTSYFPNYPSGYARAKYEPTSFRNRSASAATIPTRHLASVSAMVLGKESDRIDEYESALVEEDEMDIPFPLQEGRRFSEAPRSLGMMYQGIENQRLENLRQTTWQSGGMFGVPEVGTQSRRHSFAGHGAEFPNSDLAKRAMGSGENGPILGGRSNNYLSLTDVSHFDNARKESLYGNENPRLQPRQSFSSTKTAPLGPLSAATANQHHLNQLQAYAANTRTSPPPHRPLMGMSMHTQPRSQQLLYFVTFKACRGDVFYVQEGTGLGVRVGDLVIVEADRGTDLGTVIAENITWQQAKELKEHYAKEQYNVLMMYATRRATAPGAPPPSGSGLNGVNPHFPNGNPTGAGPNHGQAQVQDSQAQDLKPKMIKRLAQPHEIQTLRDKEANEAKAKRVCQQKVLEHRLPMEILDAEFQMDWKKLTFYYFADSYINFNSLVTDLFKVYKTRIWMSAMNPASFAHPTGPSLAQHNSLGPIGEPVNDGLHSQYAGQNQAYSAYNGPGPTGGLLGAQRGPGPQNVGLHQQLPMNGFPSRHSPATAELLSQNNYNSLYLNGSGGLPSQPSSNVLGDGPNPNSDIWMGMQGLSLNSH